MSALSRRLSFPGSSVALAALVASTLSTHTQVVTSSAPNSDRASLSSGASHGNSVDAPNKVLNVTGRVYSAFDPNVIHHFP